MWPSTPAVGRQNYKLNYFGYEKEHHSACKIIIVLLVIQYLVLRARTKERALISHIGIHRFEANPIELWEKEVL